MGLSVHHGVSWCLSFQIRVPLALLFLCDGLTESDVLIEDHLCSLLDDQGWLILLSWSSHAQLDVSVRWNVLELHQKVS